MLEMRYWHVASRRVGKPRGYLCCWSNEPSKERATRYKFYDFHGTSQPNEGLRAEYFCSRIDRAKTARRDEIGLKLVDE